MHGNFLLKNKQIFLVGLVFVALTIFLGTKHFQQKQKIQKGLYTSVAQALREASQGDKADFCERQVQDKRLYLAKVIDEFRPLIQGLWAKQDGRELPKSQLLPLGKIQLRLSPEARPKHPYDQSSWSWEEAQGLLLKTQLDPRSPASLEAWRNLDTMARYLLEKDSLRIVEKRVFVPPKIAQHLFRPNLAMRRTGPKEFTVPLNAGDFAGEEAKLQKLLESEWSGAGYRVRLEWKKDPSLYTFRINLLSSRSFVNHKKRTLEIANMAWTKTVAHEFGHVLGFADHYYSVWHADHCYYTQETRNADLMSNSDIGQVNTRHWQVLDQAYPWQKRAVRELFAYQFGD